MKAQPKVRRPKDQVVKALDIASKKLDEARTDRLSAQADEKDAEKKCADLMAGHDLDRYQLADGRILTYGPKSDKMGCKISAAPEDEHEPADDRQAEIEVVQ